MDIDGYWWIQVLKQDELQYAKPYTQTQMMYLVYLELVFWWDVWQCVVLAQKKRWVVKGNIIPWTGGIVSPTGLPLNYGSRKFIAISAEVTPKGSSVNPSEKALNNSG